MTHPRRDCEDAAFDVLLERTLGAPAPDVAARVVQRRPHGVADDLPRPSESSPPPRRWLAAALVMLGVGVLGWAAWSRGSEPAGRSSGPASDGRSAMDGAEPAAPPEQDPASGQRIQLRSAEHLRELIPEIRGAHATLACVVVMDFPIGAVRAMQVDYVQVESVRVSVDEPGTLAGALADAFAKPQDQSPGYPDEIVDLRLTLAGDQYVTLRCFRHGERVACSHGALSLRMLDQATSRRVLDIAADLRRIAAKRFVFAGDAATLAAAPPSVVQAICYGIEDQGLAPLAKMTALQELQLVSRRLDEYPQDYQGVPITAAALRHVASCRELRKLEVLGGHLDDAALLSIARLPHLTHLSIGEAKRCTFGAAGLRALAGMPTLESLELAGCVALDDEGLAALGASTSLRDISIDYLGRGTGAGLRDLLDAPDLRTLALRNVTADGVFERERPAMRLESLELHEFSGGLHGIASMPNLRHFDARECEFPPQTLQALATSRLETLAIFDCDGIAEDLWAVGQLASLTSLSVQRLEPGIDWERTLEAMRGLRRLRTLRLLQCRLTDEHLPALEKLATLETLDVRFNSLSEPAAIFLRSKIPSVTVLSSIGR